MTEQFVLPNGAVVTASGEQADRYRAKGWAKTKPAPKSARKPAKKPKSESEQSE